MFVVNYFYKQSEDFKQVQCWPKVREEWIRKVTRISQQKRGVRPMGRGRNAFYAEMEKQLYGEIESARSVGKSVKRWCFNKRGRQILNEMGPDNNFKFSNRWFENLKSVLIFHYEERRTVLKNHRRNWKCPLNNCTLTFCMSGEMGHMEIAISQICAKRPCRMS